MSEPKDDLLDHDYDGIQEYDNPLPRWWLMILYGSIAWALFYVPWYHFGPGPLAAEEYAEELKAAGEGEGAAPRSVTFTAEELKAAVADAAKVAEGKKVFDTNCVACHTATGAGLVGPNLTDEFWIHGGSLVDIARVVTDGVPDKGMIAWKTQLSSAQIVGVTAYIRTLKGTNPPNPKAPQGDKYEGVE